MASETRVFVLVYSPKN